jgi:hypothetical protein
MKGTFFSKPLEWNIETVGESWQQGEVVKGTLKVTNHGSEAQNLEGAAIELAHADIKKVQTKVPDLFKHAIRFPLNLTSLEAGKTHEMNFEMKLPDNCPVTDKKASFYLSYGNGASTSSLQLSVQPLALFGKLVGLLDTFMRFKLKEFKGSKVGVEYKLIPPSSRDMANLDTAVVTFSMKEQTLLISFEFAVKKLDTSGVTNKIDKSKVTIQRELSPKEYSLGRDMINQDQLLKVFESIISEVKLKSVF